MELALGGAVLLDLALRDRIDANLRELRVADPTPTGDPLLDPVLAELAAAAGTRATREWIWTLGRRPGLRDRLGAVVLGDEIPTPRDWT